MSLVPVMAGKHAIVTTWMGLVPVMAGKHATVTTWMGLVPVMAGKHAIVTTWMGWECSEKGGGSDDDDGLLQNLYKGNAGLHAGPHYCQSHMFWWTHGC